MNPRLSSVVLLSLLVACQRSSSEQAGPAPSASVAPESTGLELSTPLSPEQQNAALSIKASLDEKRWELKAPEAKDPAQRQVLLSLATSLEEKDYPLVGAALRALTALPAEKSPSNDLLRVVELQSQSKSPRVVRRVLLLSQKSATRDKASNQLADALLAAGKVPPLDHGNGRYLLVDTLLNFPQGVVNRKALADLLVDSVDRSEAGVQAQALQGLVKLGRFASKRSHVQERALALTTHTEAIVRGSALQLLGELGKGTPDAVAASVLGLEAEKPFVRAAACSALESLGNKGAIHALVKLVDDKAVVKEELSGPDPDGGMVRKLFTVGQLGFVQESAINAIHQLSGRAFELGLIPPNDPLAGLEKQAKAVKDWYKKAKKDLPALDAVPATSASAVAKGAPPAGAPKGAATTPGAKTTPPSTTPASASAKPHAPAAPPKP